MKHLGLVPIRNFAVVDEGCLFRSAQPQYRYEYEWLKKVANINLIINLRSESRHDQTVCSKVEGIDVLNIDIPDHHEPTLKQAKDFIKRIKVALANGVNVLFHCEHGHGRTSTFCVLARLAMGWTLEKALKEEKERFHYVFHHAAQAEFLKRHFSNINN